MPDHPSLIVSEQSARKFVEATPFQRFTIRLIDGRFVRIPKPELPSTQGVDPTGTSNQTEMRDLFRLVNGQFVRTDEIDPASASRPCDTSLPDLSNLRMER